MGSAYHSALSLDPRFAEASAGLPAPKNPPLFRFDTKMHALSDIADLLIARLVKDPGTAKVRRPLTARDHRSLAKRQAAMDRAVAIFSPHHAHLAPRVSA